MHVINNVPLLLDVEQVLRRQGIRDRSKLQPRFMSILHELLTTVNDLLEPAFAYELHFIAKLRHDQLYLKSNTVLHSSPLLSLLSSAKMLAAMVCTMGARLEERVANYFTQDDPLRAVILDGIGNAAVDTLAQEACQFIKHEASSLGYKASSPLSPGMDGWPISEQRQLFRMVPAERIGVHLTSSAFMVPLKSILMVIGIGLEMPTWTQAQTCGRCGLKETCLYRVLSIQTTEPKNLIKRS